MKKRILSKLAWFYENVLWMIIPLFATTLVASIFAFWLWANDANAADYIDIDNGFSGAAVSPANAYYGMRQTFTPTKDNISALTLFICLYNSPLNATSTLSIFKTSDGSSFPLISQTISPWVVCDYDDLIELTHPVAVIPGQSYTFQIISQAGVSAPYPANFSAGGGNNHGGGEAWIIATTSQTWVLANSVTSVSDWYFETWYDDEFVETPSDPQAEILDSETFFNTGLMYKFKDEHACVMGQSCELDFSYSAAAIGQPLYFWYSLNNTYDVDSGIIASVTPTDNYYRQGTITLPSETATSSFKQWYCAQATSDISLTTYRSCDIMQYWLTSDEWDRTRELLTASTTLTEKLEDCTTCTEESGYFACGMKKAYCYLFIPQAEDVIRLYDLKKTVEQNFPMNIAYDFKTTLSQYVASTSATTSAVQNASTTGLYMYWNGEITDVPILTPKMFDSMPDKIQDIINTWLGYIIYIWFIVYVFRRAKKFRDSQP